MNLRPALLSTSLILLGGCALVYHYGDYQDQGPGTGGTGGGSSTSSGSTATSSSGTGTGGGSSTSSGTGASSASSSGTGGSTTTTTTSTTSSTTTTTVTCTGTETCVVIPTGWMGPVALETATTSPGCPEAGWPTPDPSLKGGSTLTTPTGCTACTCTGPTGTCPSMVALKGVGQVNCGGTMTPTLVSTACQGFAYSGAEGSPTTATVASCAGSTPSPTPAVTFGSFDQGCTGGVTAACTGGVCVKPAARLCVYMPGKVPCPTGFPTKKFVYTAIVDNYACSACTCSVGSPPTCVPTTSFFSDSGCGDLIASLKSDGATCATFSAPPTWSKVTDVGTPGGGSCTPTGGGVLTGSAMLASPITVCCSP